MFVIINGAPGSGKSKTGKLLLETTNNSAFIDGDWLLATNPHGHREQRHLRYKNIASVARNYYTEGFKTVFISFVYVNDEDMTEQIRQLNDLATVKVFALVPSEEVLRKRHKEDDYKRESIESSVKLNKEIAEMKNIITIDNSELSVEEVVKEIKTRIA